MVQTEKVTLIVNIVLLGVLLFNIFRCFHKGFLLSLWECFGTFFALLISWNCSKLFSSLYLIYPLDWTPMADTPLGVVFQAKCNQLMWGMLLFCAVKLVLLLLKPFVKMIGGLPLIKQANALFGAVFGVVITILWSFLAVILLSVPVFKQGERIIEQSLLKPVKECSVYLIDEVNTIISENELLSKVLLGQALDQDDELLIEEWLKEYHLDEASLKDYFN